MEQKTFTYKLGGKEYTQSPLRYIQIQQLLGLMKGIVFSGDLNAAAIMAHLVESGEITRFFAIILLPAGMPLRQKNIDDLAEELSFDISIDDAGTITKVIEDFLLCNLDPSRLQKMQESVGTLSEKIQAVIPSTKQSVSSRGETLPKKTTSSTDTDHETQRPISNSESERSSLENASSDLQPEGKG